MERTEQHDLSVEEFGLNGTRPPRQALPAGAALPLPDAVAAICTKSPRRSRSSSELATSIPAAANASLPSRWASRASGPKRPSGPASASTALARFMRSLRYFQRMMSGRATDWKVVVAMAPAIATPWSPKPPGNRPMSSSPRPGRVQLHDTGTQLGGGHITQIP